MCVPCHSFSCFLRLVGHTNHGVDPIVALIQHAAGSNGQTLGGKPEALNVGHADQALADQDELFRLEVVGIATGDDDILELGPTRNVGEGFFPTSAGRLERSFGHSVCVGAHCIGASAEHTVGWTDGGGWYVRCRVLVEWLTYQNGAPFPNAATETCLARIWEQTYVKREPCRHIDEQDP